jgi:hypothetical protein
MSLTLFFIILARKGYNQADISLRDGQFRGARITNSNPPVSVHEWLRRAPILGCDLSI